MRAIDREEMLELSERDCCRGNLTPAEEVRLDKLLRIKIAEEQADERQGRPLLYGGDYSDL